MEAIYLILEIDEGQLKTVEETTNWSLRSMEASEGQVRSST